MGRRGLDSSPRSLCRQRRYDSSSLFTHTFLSLSPKHFPHNSAGRHPAPRGAEAGDCQVRFRRQRREDQLQGRDGEFFIIFVGVCFFSFRSFLLSLSLSLSALTPYDYRKKCTTSKKPTPDGLLRHPARRARGRQGHLRDGRDQRRQRPRVLLLEERRKETRIFGRPEREEDDLDPA